MRTIRIHLLVPVALLSAMLSSCSGNATEGSAKSSAPVRVATVLLQRGPITRSITLPGSIFPWEKATLYAQIPGYLKSIGVDKGSAVTRGEVLAEIEDPDLVAELPKYEAELQLAGINYARIRKAEHRAPDLVMPETLDEARGQLAVARANLERIHDLLAYSRIVAPFDGIVTHRWLDPGAFVPAATSASAAHPAAVVTVMDFTRVRVDVAVPENEVPFISTGTRATITLGEIPGRKFAGKVSRFAYALNQTTRTMMAEIDLPNPRFELRPGMYAMVKLGVQRNSHALLAPLRAISQAKEGSSVYLVDDGKAKEERIRVGFNNGSEVEILHGARVGQAVILLDGQALRNDQPVTIDP